MEKTWLELEGKTVIVTEEHLNRKSSCTGIFKSWFKCSCL